LTLLVIREVQTKIIVRYNFPSTRMAGNKKLDNQILARMGRNWNPHTLLVWMWNGATALKNCQFLKWLSRELTTWPRNSTPRYISKRNGACVHTETCTWIFIAALFIIVLRNNQIVPSADEGIHEMWYVHTMEQYLVIKRNGILIHDTTWMNFEDMLSERNQSHTKIWFHSYGSPE